MYKKLIITSIIACFTFSMQAQTVFSTMESWKTVNVGFGIPPPTIEIVDGWRCPDSLAHAFAILLGGTPERQLFKSTDKHSGTYAARVVTKEQGMLGVLPGILTNAIINLDITNQDFSLSGGTPIYGRVYYVNSWIKYTPQGGDSAFIAVSALKKGAGVGGIDSILGSGLYTITASQPYTQINVPITYENTSLNPDALQINFASSGGQATVGSELLIDDVSYSIFPASTGNVAEKEKIAVYPNPASDYITVNTSGKASKIAIYSMDGKWLLEKNVTGIATVDIATLAQGTYFYTLSDNNGVVLQKNTFVVSK